MKSTSLKVKKSLETDAVAKLINIANKYECKILLKKDDKIANLKSIMGVISIALKKDDEIIIESDGKMEEDALEAIKIFFA